MFAFEETEEDLLVPVDGFIMSPSKKTEVSDEGQKSTVMIIMMTKIMFQKIWRKKKERNEWINE